MNFFNLKTDSVNASLKGVGQKVRILTSTWKVSFKLSIATHTIDLNTVLVVDDLALSQCDLSEKILNICEQEVGVRVLSFSVKPEISLGQDLI